MAQQDRPKSPVGAARPPARRRAPPTSKAQFRPIAGSSERPLEDHRRYPLCRLVLACTACAWARGYNPERIIARLRALRLGGHPTLIQNVARHVGWSCPACGRTRWMTCLAYPLDLDEAEARRQVRNLRS